MTLGFDHNLLTMRLKLDIRRRTPNSFYSAPRPPLFSNKIRSWRFTTAFLGRSRSEGDAINGGRRRRRRRRRPRFTFESLQRSSCKYEKKYTGYVLACVLPCVKEYVGMHVGRATRGEKIFVFPMREYLGRKIFSWYVRYFPLQCPFQFHVPLKRRRVFFFI